MLAIKYRIYEIYLLGYLKQGQKTIFVVERLEFDFLSLDPISLISGDRTNQKADLFIVII